MKNKNNILVYFAIFTTLLAGCSFAKPEIKIESFTLNFEELSLFVGESETITASFNPSDATNKSLSFETSASDIISLTSKGLITALKEGNTTIIVSTLDGSSLTKEVSVSVSEYSSLSYDERIKDMKQISVSLDQDDANIKESLEYNVSAPLGSAAHPLSNSETEFLEISVVEQPDNYGDAYFIKAGEASVIIDCGNYSSDYFDDGTKYGDYLNQIYQSFDDDKSLDLLVMSHPHADHYGGYQSILDSFDDVQMIVDYGYTDYNYYESDVRSYYKNRGANYMSIYDAVHEVNGGLARTYITNDCFIDWYDTGLYTTPYTSGTRYSDENVTCVVGMLSYKKFSFFFSGDLQGVASYGDEGIDGEQYLIDNNTNNSLFHQVTMAKIAHHGSSNGSQSFLLSKLNPKIATISAGGPSNDTSWRQKRGICGGHPHEQVIDRLYRYTSNVQAYLNYVNGTTSFVTNGLNSVYMKGSPLKSNLWGDNNGKEVTYSVNDTIDEIHELRDTKYYQTCILGN